MSIIANNLRLAGRMTSMLTPEPPAPFTPTTWNPDDKGSNVTLSNGNLTMVSTGSDGRGVRSVASVTSGKYYWENIIDVDSNSAVGIMTSAANVDRYPGFDTNGIGYWSDHRITFGSLFDLGFDTYTTSDIISVAIDMGTGKIWFAKNGVWQGSGDPANGTNAVQDLNGSISLLTELSPNNIFVGAGRAATGGSNTITANFGATAFVHTVPAGFNEGFGN